MTFNNKKIYEKIKTKLNVKNYLSNIDNDWHYIKPNELYKLLNKNTNNKHKLFLLDIRKPEDYKQGHIKDSINIQPKDIMKQENLQELMNKEIIIICYSGHTASQVLVLLRLLGYNVKALKYGMKGWEHFTKKLTN